MDAKALYDFVNTAGVLGLSLIIIVALLRGWVHTSKEFDNLRRDRDEWKQLALRGTGIVERAVSLGGRGVDHGVPGPDNRRTDDA